MTIDTANHASVALTGDGRLRVLNPAYLTQPLTPDEALVVASWLVALADPSGQRFAAILKEVQET